MEEKRQGQQPEADRPTDALQSGTARPGGRVDGGLSATEGHRDRVAQAHDAGEKASEEMRERGFGDHKGVDGFPGLPRDD